MRNKVRLADVKPDDILITDGGFTCMKSGQHRVHRDQTGNLFIKCSYGNHYLDGQLDDDGTLVGLTRG